MLSKRASTVYVSWNEKELILPAFSARNSSARKPATTNSPTQKSRALFFIAFSCSITDVRREWGAQDGCSRPAQQRGRQEGQAKNGQRRDHHRTGGGAAAP